MTDFSAKSTSSSSNVAAKKDQVADADSRIEQDISKLCVDDVAQFACNFGTTHKGECIELIFKTEEGRRWGRWCAGACSRWPANHQAKQFASLLDTIDQVDDQEQLKQIENLLELTNTANQVERIQGISPSFNKFYQDYDDSFFKELKKLPGRNKPKLLVSRITRQVYRDQEIAKLQSERDGSNAKAKELCVDIKNGLDEIKKLSDHEDLRKTPTKNDAFKIEDEISRNSAVININGDININFRRSDGDIESDSFIETLAKTFAKLSFQRP